MSKNVLTSRALKSLSYALIHSNLIYVLHIWSSAPVSIISLLEKTQKKAIRIINLAPYNSHNEPLFKKSEILPLKNLIEYFKLLFMYDYKNNLYYHCHLPICGLQTLKDAIKSEKMHDNSVMTTYWLFPLSGWNSISDFRYLIYPELGILSRKIL
jgi:sulfur relay (sulfurtransferase) DsrF/TusC family protein